MAGASKILTVSYGTFSCTLEGFDDPFTTMRHIAEYFRDLSADDRYFGAEPPQPDTEMLHEIAERSIRHRVAAELRENGVVLRQERDETPEPTLSRAGLAAATAPEVDDDTVAGKIERMRRAAAEDRATTPAAAFESDTEAAEAAPEPAPEPDIMAAPSDDDDKVTPDGDTPVFADADADADEDDAADWPDVAAETEPETTAPAADADTPEAAEDAEAEDADALLLTTLARVRAADADTAPDATEPTAEDSAPDTQDAAPDAAPETGADTAAGDEHQGISERARAAAERARARLSQFAHPAPEHDSEPEPTDSTASEEAQPLAEADTPRTEDLAAEPMTEPAMAEDTEDDAEEVSADADLSETDAEGSTPAALDAAEAGDRPDEDADADAAAPVARSAFDADGLEEEEAALDRLLETTNSKLSGPETARKQNAFAQLKAAVAATWADRQLKHEGTPGLSETPDETADLDAYREDLERATGARATGRDRPAPLVLVSEQRIDESEAEPEARAGGPIRPRRVTTELEDVAAEDAALEDSGSFQEFADRIGASSLPELLEAAAAYTAHVEGRARFSRAQVMSKIAHMKSGDFTREAGLRSFGKLLREGRIRRVQDGQFVITEDSRFVQEARTGTR